jgi:hypothetical protein
MGGQYGAYAKGHCQVFSTVDVSNLQWKGVWHEGLSKDAPRAREQAERAVRLMVRCSFLVATLLTVRPSNSSATIKHARNLPRHLHQVHCICKVTR